MSVRRRNGRSSMLRTPSTDGKRAFSQKMIFERVQIERVDFFGVALPDALIEALAALIAQPAALDHFAKNGGSTKRSRQGSLGTRS